jgi:hypothetical protein
MLKLSKQFKYSPEELYIFIKVMISLDISGNIKPFSDQSVEGEMNPPFVFIPNSINSIENRRFSGFLSLA